MNKSYKIVERIPYTNLYKNDIVDNIDGVFYHHKDKKEIVFLTDDLIKKYGTEIKLFPRLFNDYALVNFETANKLQACEIINFNELTGEYDIVCLNHAIHKIYTVSSNLLSHTKRYYYINEKCAVSIGFLGLDERQDMWLKATNNFFNSKNECLEKINEIIPNKTE